MRHPRFLQAAVAAAAVLLVASSAWAQTFDQGLGDPRLISPAGLGPSYSGLTGAGLGLVSKKPLYGIAAGEFVLQPRLFVEGGYRTNFFRVDSRTADPTGAMELHIRPGVALFNPDFDKVALSMGLDVDVFLPISDDAAVTDQSNVGGSARIAVALWPKSALTLTLHEEFDRAIWMRPQIVRNGNRNWNRVGADLAFHPGGRALDISVGYSHIMQRYDKLDQLDTDDHLVRLLASWRFYPMTYAFLEGTVAFRSYSKATTEAEEAHPGNYVPGKPVKLYLGLSGYITERLALLARAGYGNTLLERDPEDFSSFIGQLQLSYRFSPKSIIHLGVARDFEMAPLGGYYSYFRTYTSFTQRIGELAELHVDFSYDIKNFGEWQPAPREGSPAVVASDANREDHFVRAGVLLDFDISRLLGATIGYRYDAVLSDYTLSTTTQTNHVAYDDHRVFASLNLRY